MEERKKIDMNFELSLKEYNLLIEKISKEFKEIKILRKNETLIKEKLINVSKVISNVLENSLFYVKNLYDKQMEIDQILYDLRTEITNGLQNEFKNFNKNEDQNEPQNIKEINILLEKIKESEEKFDYFHKLTEINQNLFKIRQEYFTNLKNNLKSMKSKFKILENVSKN